MQIPSLTKTIGLHLQENCSILFQKLKQVKAHLLLIFSTVIASANYTVIKTIVPFPLSANALILMRSASGALFFYFLEKFIAPKTSIEKKDYLPVFLSGLLGVTLNQVFFYNGMSITTPINGSIFNLINPITIVIFASVLLKEKVNIYGIVSIIMSLSGAFLLLDFANFSVSDSTFWGDVMVCINAVCFGVYIVIVTPLVRKYNPYIIVKWNFITAFVFLLPLGWSDIRQTDWQAFDAGAWNSLAYIILLTTLLVYFLNYYLPQITSPGTIAIYVYFQPFIATLVAVWSGKDELTTIKVVSGLLIISGIYLSQYGRRKQAAKQL